MSFEDAAGTTLVDRYEAFGKLYVEQVRDRSIASFDGRALPETLCKDPSGGFEQTIDLILAHFADVFLEFLANLTFTVAIEEEFDGKWVRKLLQADSDMDRIREEIDGPVLASGRFHSLYFVGRPTATADRRRSEWVDAMNADAAATTTLFVSFVVDQAAAGAMVWMLGTVNSGDSARYVVPDFAHNEYFGWHADDEDTWRHKYSDYPIWQPN